MKPSIIIMIALAAAGGWSIARFTGGSGNVAAGSRKIICYQSPMHPWVKSDHPGQCTVCGMDLVPVYEGENGFDHAVSDVVMLPPGSVRAVGIQVLPTRVRSLVRTLRVAGMIGEDESRHGVISAPVEGRIDGLSMNHEGQQITRRQPLATMFSRTLLSAANDYNVAVSQGDANATTLTKRRLEQYGLVWEQIEAIPRRQPDDLYFGILAPLTGTIVKANVAEGQYVKEGDRMFEIADFTKMWFHFMAYEPDLPWLQLGQVVTLQTASWPGHEIKARVAFISPNLDEMTRSAKVRVVVENPDRKIKNNSFAEGVVTLESPEVLTVTRTAVLWPGGMPRVYVEKEVGTYVPRNVKLGRAGDAEWEVLEGLQAGDRVVTSGNMLIDSQAQLDKIE